MCRRSSVSFRVGSRARCGEHAVELFEVGLGSVCAASQSDGLLHELGFGLRQFRCSVWWSPDLSAAFTFITPNAVHDMLNGTVAQGDAFLSSYVPALMATRSIRRVIRRSSSPGTRTRTPALTTRSRRSWSRRTQARSRFRRLQSLFAASDGGGSAWLAGAWRCRFGGADGERVRAYGQSAAASFAPANTALPVISGTAQQGQTADHVQWVVDQQPDRVCLPVAGLRRRGRELHLDLRGDDEQLHARLGRSRPHDPGGRHGQQRGRPRRRNLSPDHDRHSCVVTGQDPACGLGCDGESWLWVDHWL